MEIDDFAGLASRQPALRPASLSSCFRCWDLPVTAGFLGKFYIFNAALASHLVWLAVLLALNSVIASFYYLRVIVVMYMREPNQDWPPVAHALGRHAGSLGRRRRNLLPRSVPRPRHGLRDASGALPPAVAILHYDSASPLPSRECVAR